MFDKSERSFPAKKNSLFFAHCAISPLQQRAKEAAQDFLEAMAAGGISGLPPYFNLLPLFHENGGKLLQTNPENISFVHNTAEAMCLLANGYPFQPGDEIVSYVHEFPSNHYPWRLQEKRGVKLVLLGDSDPLGTLGDVAAPRGWSMEELESRVTPRTRVIALSHVQFTNGYAADLKELGAFCRERGIDLIIDGAQSLGCLPLYPEEYHVAAIAASGWKWLMGPFGSGILYTSPALREKIELTMVGPYCMQQGLDYLNHQWNPLADGRKFEYSTLAWEHVAALNGVLESVFLRYSMETVRAEVFRLQDLFLQYLDQKLFRVLLYPEEHRSGILTLLSPGNSEELVKKVGRQGLVLTARSDYIRIAPHFYLSDDNMKEAAELLNREAGGR